MQLSGVRSDSTIGGFVWRVGLHVLALALAVYVLYRGAFFLKVAAVAVVLATAAETPVGALTRRGWNRVLAVLLVVGAAAGTLIGLASFLVPTLVREGQRFAEQAPELLGDLRDTRYVDWIQRHVGGLGQLSDLAREKAPGIADLALTAASGAVGALTGVITLVALTGFILVSGPRLWRTALEWVHPDRREHAAELGSRIRSAVAGYIVGVLSVGLIAGVVTGVTMLVLGVPFALPLAVAAGLLGIVPYVGAIISGVLVVATTFATAGQTAGIIAAVVFFGYQQAEGALLEPLIQRKAIELDPLIVLFGLLLGIGALGVWGGVMALPLLAAAKVVADDALKRRRERWRREGRLSMIESSAPAPAAVERGTPDAQREIDRPSAH